jgi:hypothetical protein
VVDISGLEEKVRRHCETIVTEAADQMLADMLEDMPYKTGELYDSAGVTQVQSDGYSSSVEIFVDSDVANFVDEGTMPHVISSSSQPHGVLVFDGSNGDTVFVGGSAENPASVLHPGTASNPFFSQRMPDRWTPTLQQVADGTVTS